VERFDGDEWGSGRGDDSGIVGSIKTISDLGVVRPQVMLTTCIRLLNEASKYCSQTQHTNELQSSLLQELMSLCQTRVIKRETTTTIYVERLIFIGQNIFFGETKTS